jgi:hypothetical protein
MQFAGLNRSKKQNDLPPSSVPADAQRAKESPGRARAFQVGKDEKGPEGLSL